MTVNELKAKLSEAIPLATQGEWKQIGLAVMTEWHDLIASMSFAPNEKHAVANGRFIALASPANIRMLLDEDRWIPVEERLPDFDREILYAVAEKGCTKKFVKRGMLCFDGNDRWWCDERGEYSEDGNDPGFSTVTEWRYIPEPPAAQEGESK